MYLSFYNLREFPFSLSFQERFFYAGSVQTAILANMNYNVQQRKGMVLVTGEVGAGKTFIGNMLVASLGPGCASVLVKHPPRSELQLLKALGARTGMSLPAGDDEHALVEGLQQHLTRLQAQGRLAALIIDEAQDLSDAALEEVRLLWNWERGGQSLVQIVLISQPELRQRLSQPRWQSLRQRVVLSYHLGRLSAEETAKYILHRLTVAADGLCLAEFTPEANADIHAATGGIPRLINILCDNALLLGYARDNHEIGREIVAEVLKDRARWALHADQAQAEALDQSEAAEGYDVPAPIPAPAPVPEPPAGQMMTRCPVCKTGYEIRQSKIGKKARCRKCGASFEIALVIEDVGGAS